MPGILDVHLSEYQAITNRITNWTTLQYVVYSVVAAYLGLVVHVLGDQPGIDTVWECTLGLTLLVWAWFYATWEIVNDALYLETSLREKVESCLESGDFWGYEPYLAKVRSGFFTPLEQWGVIAVLSLGGCGWIGHVWTATKAAPPGDKALHYLMLVNGVVFVLMAARGIVLQLTQNKLKKVGIENLRKDLLRVRKKH